MQRLCETRLTLGSSRAYEAASSEVSVRVRVNRTQIAFPDAAS